MDNQVLFDVVAGVDGDIGIITLNRPEVLNSLNLSMINAMYSQLQSWAVNEAIKAVVIRATEGRAFCAGGDLRFTYDFFKSRDPKGLNFFRDEYRLNQAIFHYPKPYIAFMDGITMGGGVGISIHGSHRVATERLLFAMPETGIGFFPDVGGSYFLPRLPAHMGYYLGLTGARVNSDDCAALGITQYTVASESLSTVLQALASHAFGQYPHAVVTEVINQFTMTVGSSDLMQQQTEIEQCFSSMSMDEVMLALQHATQSKCQDAVSMLSKKSPTSLKVTLAALHRGAQLDFDACMQQEYDLACHFTQGHDFPEGIRAVIIDKDQSPHWQPATLQAVNDQIVKQYFSKIKAL